MGEFMKKNIVTSLLLGSALVAPSVHAQTSELEILRAQVAAMEAQIDALNARLDQYATVSQESAAQNAAQIADVAALAESTAASIPEPAEDDGISISFSGAPEIEGEGGWSFKPFGRLHVDAGLINIPDGAGRTDGFSSEMRRARIGVGGDIPGGFVYKVEVDFAGGSGELTDALFTYKDDGLKLTLGQHNNFQSLEELTSSRWSSFIERAAFTDAFGFERRLGASAEIKSGDFMLQTGFFTDNIGDLPGKTWSLDGRAVYSPTVGDAQLHFGGSLHYTNLESGDTVRYRQRPLVHFTSERLINTGNIWADSELGIGAEAAVISGPFHAVAEGFRQTVNMPGAGTNPDFFGGYVELGYFLTEGDSRGYKGGKFNRTRPASPIDEGGSGAFQVNVRYDHLDLNSGPVIGGTQNGYMASLVWVPTDYTRFSVSYAHLVYDDAVYSLPGGDTSYSADVLGLRGQIDF